MTEQDLGPPDNGWAQFFADNGDALLRAAVATLGLHAHAGLSAEDIVSKVLTKLIKRGIPRAANSRAYVIKAVKNAALDEIDTSSRFDDRETIFDEHIGVENFEDDIDDELLGEAVVAALDELPEREARAIREKVMKDRHWADVAPEFGVTTSQGLGKIVNAGLDKLRKMPRFADLAPTVSSTSTPRTAPGTPRATTP